MHHSVARRQHRDADGGVPSWPGEETAAECRVTQETLRAAIRFRA
jgi:hypothetical protein